MNAPIPREIGMLFRTLLKEAVGDLEAFARLRERLAAGEGDLDDATIAAGVVMAHMRTMAERENG